ncbi:ankyrin repeat-containing domain protein, partial [Cyathus striatus]
NTPLMTAIAYNRIDVAKVLLQHPEVDVKAKDLWNKSILAYAIDLPSEQMIRTLLERDDIDVNATFDSGFLDEWSPLAYAIQEGTTLRLSMVPILLRKSNIDINCIASTGYTPLMLAVKGGHLEIFNLLLK